jgi:N-hydroxyarylamine O-acetyltransferase
MNVEAYLHRIRYYAPLAPAVDRPTIDLLRSLHRAHLLAVPFENLDISLGREIVCDEARILHKIVNEHRGGFCYELNGAFAALLRELGFRVTLLSARVALEDGGYSPEFDHLALRVDLEESWLADVGFGECFMEPLRLAFRTEQQQGGKTYRLTSRPTEDGDVFDLAVLVESGWKPEYAFTLRPHQFADFAGMCRYHQTSPDSHFTRQRICSMATPEGRVTLSEEKLIETRTGSRQETFLTGKEEWRAKLRERFGVVLPQ